MAKYIAVRPRWNPRGVVVNYAVRGQLYARGWPSGYRDANTASQRRQRGKMAQVCDALPYLKSLLAEGYRPRRKRNGRKIGSYQIAVSEALKGCFDETPQGPTLNLSRLRLTEGVARLPRGLRVTREGAALRVVWGEPLGRQQPKLLLAAREGSRNEWVGLPMPLAEGVMGVRVTLPPQWQGRAIETWVAFVGHGGRARTKTRYATLPPTPRATGTVTTALGSPAGAAAARGAGSASPRSASARAAYAAAPSPRKAPRQPGIVEYALTAPARKGPRPRWPSPT